VRCKEIAEALAALDRLVHPWDGVDPFGFEHTAYRAGWRKALEAAAKIETPRPGHLAACRCDRCRVWERAQLSMALAIRALADKETDR